MLNQTPHNLATCRRCRAERGLPNDDSAVVRLCPIDHRPIAVHAKDGICPAKPSKFVTVGVPQKVMTNVMTPPAASPWEVQGPKMWAEFHRWALTADVATEYAQALGLHGWLFEFRRRIPCGECRIHWQQWTAANPPDTTGNASLFEWTWRAHEAVNVRLGKPEFGLGAALLRWAT